MLMQKLKLPAFDIKIVQREGKNYVLDVIRRRYVALTPEEWVRQHFIHYLLQYKKYPQALMANEVQLNLNGNDDFVYKRYWDMSGNHFVESHL